MLQQANNLNTINKYTIVELLSSWVHIILQNYSSKRGLVKISISCFSIRINFKAITLFLSWSLKKWCLVSTSLDLECWMRFFWQVYGVSIITHVRDMVKVNLIISKSLFHLNGLSIKIVGDNVFGLSGWKCNWILLFTNVWNKWMS